MNALERAARDAQRGDLGSARRRLRSRIASAGYSPEVCEELARLSLRMSDPFEAGRWYYLCDSSDPESAGAVESFVRACKNNPRQIAAQIPASVRRAAPESLPPAVRRRIEHIQALAAAPTNDDEEFGCGGWIFTGCLVGAIGGCVLAAIGAVVTVRWAIQAVF